MITPNRCSAEAKASFTVADEAPVMLTGYSHKGKMILPETVYARWFLRDGTWRIREVSVSGAVLKTDGTPGAVTTKRYAFQATLYDGDGRWEADTPQWVKDAVLAHDPQRGF